MALRVSRSPEAYAIAIGVISLDDFLRQREAGGQQLAHAAIPAAEVD